MDSAHIVDYLVKGYLEMSVSTLSYLLSCFFLVHKLYKTGMQVTHLISYFGLSLIYGQCGYWRLFSSGICRKVTFHAYLLF